MVVLCRYCSNEFSTYPAWIRKGGGKTCSTRCSGMLKRGKTTYARTSEQNKKMSAILKNTDLSKQRERFIEMNIGRKGKSFEEIYGDRAAEMRKNLGKTGELNPNWKGGVHRNRYPYIFFTLRVVVLERDKYVCLNCGMTDEEARSKDSLNRGLTIHHIDYNKENNSLDNLATTCKWCNSKANSGRELWIKHYHALLS